jgi:hypothetical protein
MPENQDNRMTICATKYCAAFGKRRQKSRRNSALRRLRRSDAGSRLENLCDSTVA